MTEVAIRAGQPADKPTVAAICAQCWDREDYVPLVWDEWLADPHGRLVVAERAGEVAGFGKLTLLAPGEWWLEGLRVDPAHRRQGLAGRLQAFLIEEARRSGGGMLRYATPSYNEPVHRMAAGQGGRCVAVYQVYQAETLPSGDGSPLRRLSETDLEAAWGLIESSPRYRAGVGLYEVTWIWQPLTLDRLAHHLAEGDVWGLYDDGALAGLVLLSRSRSGRMLLVGCVDGVDEALAPLLLGVRGWTREVDHPDGVQLKWVHEPALAAAVEQAGFERGYEHDIWIFELRLD